MWSIKKSNLHFCWIFINLLLLQLLTSLSMQNSTVLRGRKMLLRMFLNLATTINIYENPCRWICVGVLWGFLSGMTVLIYTLNVKSRWSIGKCLTWDEICPNWQRTVPLSGGDVGAVDATPRAVALSFPMVGSRGRLCLSFDTDDKYTTLRQRPLPGVAFFASIASPYSMNVALVLALAAGW